MLLNRQRTVVPSRPAGQTRAMWVVVVVAIALTLVATEFVLGAIKNHSGAVSDRLYVVVFAAVSVSSLVVSFFVLEFIGNLRDGQINTNRINSRDK